MILLMEVGVVVRISDLTRPWVRRAGRLFVLIMTIASELAPSGCGCRILYICLKLICRSGASTIRGKANGHSRQHCHSCEIHFAR
ncbi:hypothetical protein PENSPDRAFT_58552 [Peniophora sp. CONT]|nr:hypothetical protein PENSPDRAFT_58552 [Peniophora sp. CONT]